MKTIFALVAGYAVWTVIWLGGNAVFRGCGWLPKDASARIDSGTQLLGLLVLSALCSLAAGWITAIVAKPSSIYPQLVLAFLLLATGAVVQWGLLRLMPVWYHVTFLLLIIPLVVFGASLARRA